jgi:hypothetical protein
VKFDRFANEFHCFVSVFSDGHAAREIGDIHTDRGLPLLNNDEVFHSCSPSLSSTQPASRCYRAYRLDFTPVEYDEGAAPRPFDLLRGGAAIDYASALCWLPQSIRAVICITTNSVTIAPMVIASPVNPGRKKAYEKSTR